MTLLQLQYFQALAKRLHYTRTSEELHISQPSLSYAITELEKELGVKLFQKEKKKVNLTVQGQQFLVYVEQALSLLDQAVERVKHMASDAPQVVRMGYFHSISASFIPSLVEGFYKNFPERRIRFQFTEGTSWEVLELISSGRLDLAFCLHQAPWAQSIAVLQQPLYLAVPAGHRLAGRGSAVVDDFIDEPQIMLEPQSNLRSSLNHLFASRGYIPKIMFEVKECNAALQYVSMGFGVAVLPEVPAMASDKVSVLTLHDLDPHFIRTVYLTYHRSVALSPASQQVRDYVVQRWNLQ